MNFNDAVTISNENILTNVSDELVTVHVPEETDKIGDYAFEEVSESLRATYISENVREISPTAWHGCDKMEAVVCNFTKNHWEELTLNTPNIYLPLSCKFYFTDSVMNNSEHTVLLNPHKPDVLQAVNHYAEKVEEPHVSALAPYCAEDSWDLKEVYLGSDFNMVRSLGEGAFKNCYSLRVLKLHTNATVIPKGFMEGCTSLQQIRIPDSIFVIEKDSFRDCKSMEQLNLNKVVCIGENAFNGCHRLREIELPKTIKHVGTNVFANCSSLVSITINKEIQFLSDSFRGSPISEIIFTGTRAQFTKKFASGFMTISPDALIVCNDGILQNGELRIKNKELVAINEFTDELEVPEGVEVVNPCFYHLNVKRLVLPSTVKELGDELWLGNTGIEVYYNGTIAEWQRIKKDFTFFDSYNITKPGEYTQITCLDGVINEVYRKPYDDELEYEVDCEQVTVL